MAYDIIIPENAQVPAYALLDANAAAANDDAMFGISAGAPPRIKLSGKSFVLINEAGEETPYPPAKLKAGPDGNLYLQVVVLRAKKALSKTWYASAYNPNSEENVAPDCASTDGEKPDAGVFAPQSEVCATCPQNAYGTGTDQNGNPTAGKACQDTKRLAVFVPEFGVYELRLPPKSLKNWGQYVRELTKRNYRVDAALTFVGFELTSDYPILQFQFGGFVPEKSLPKLAELSATPVVENIVNPMGMASPAAAPKAIAAPAPAPAPEPVIEQPPAPKPEPKKRAHKPAPAPVQAAPPMEMDLGFGDATPMDAGSVAPPTDDELAAALGL